MTTTTTVISITTDTSIMNITKSNVTAEERYRYLEQLQADTTITMIPAMIFLIILGVTGLVGNTLVLFVYSQKFTRTSTRIFILSIACFDLVANVLAIPGEIYDMHHIWDFDNPTFCRSRLFFSAFTTLSSAMILLAVAVVRYRKVCAPHGWQVTLKQAKIVCLTIACLGFLFSLPYTIINGSQTKETPRPDVYGHECTTDDSYVDTIWPTLNTGFFLLLFVSCCTPLTVLYILIGVKAWKHSRVHGFSTASRTTVTSLSDSTSTRNRTRLNSVSTSSSELPREEISMSTRGSPMTFDLKSSVKSLNTKKRKLGGAKSAESIDSLGFGSVADAMEAYNPDHQKIEGPEHYTVRILKDRVEIRTPMMGEFIVHLQETINGDLDSLHAVTSRDVAEESMDIISKTAGEHGKEGSHSYGSFDENITGMNGYDNAAFSNSGESEEILKEIFPDETEMIDLEKTEDLNNGDDETNDPKNSKNHQNGNEDKIITEQVTMNDNFSAAPAKPPRKKTSCAPSESVVEEILDTTMKHEDNSEHPRHDIVAHTKNSLDDNENQTKSDNQNTDENDPMAALKWVDIIYCPEEIQGNGVNQITNESSQKDTSFSYRISGTSNVLRKAEWLRNIIAEALVKAKSQVISKQPDETESPVPMETGLRRHEFENHGIAENHEMENSHNISEDLESSQVGKDGEGKSQRPGAVRGFKRLVSKAKLKTFHRSSSKMSGSKRRPLTRTTIMLIIISAIYAVGFLPHLGLMFFKFTSPEQFAALSMVELSFYNLFLRSYFLNCAANPIIYSLCDINFRRECLQLLKCNSCRRH